MTVAELIEHLRALPQDLPVYVGDSEGYFQDTDIDVQIGGRPRLLPEVIEADPDDRHPPRKLLPRRVVIG